MSQAGYLGPAKRTGSIVEHDVRDWRLGGFRHGTVMPEAPPAFQSFAGLFDVSDARTPYLAGRILGEAACFGGT